jgi:CheY-like chemotaxis protein
MIRVLLVDDEEEWRRLITVALPEYQVDAAETYAGARELLRRGTPYDVAIVDLNLVTRAQGQLALNNLGRDLLGQLQRDCPSTPRIALTGGPLAAVARLIDRYGLADLLLKNELTLTEVSDVVKRALESAVPDLSVQLRDERGTLWTEFSDYWQSVLRGFDQEAKTLELDLRDTPRDSRRGREASDALTALAARRAAFESDCSAVAAAIAAIANEADLRQASDAFAHLRDRYPA